VNVRTLYLTSFSFFFYKSLCRLHLSRHYTQNPSHYKLAISHPLQITNKNTKIKVEHLNKSYRFHSLPFQRFQAILTLFSKFFSPFLHSTFSLSVSSIYLALGEIHLQLGLQSQTIRLVKKTINSLR